MKPLPYLFILVVLLISSCTTLKFAQYHTFQRAAYMNVLYAGIDNPIDIITSIDTSKLTLKFVSDDAKGDVQKDTEGRYIVNPSNPGKCYINIYKGKILINSQQYRCRGITGAIATLGGRYTSGNIKAAELKAQMGIVPILEGFDFDPQLRTDSFTMIYESKGELYTAKGVGPMFTNEMKSYIGTSQPKDIFIFRNIMVSSPDKISRPVPPITFIVV